LKLNISKNTNLLRQSVRYFTVILFLWQNDGLCNVTGVGNPLSIVSNSVYSSKRYTKLGVTSDWYNIEVLVHE